MDFFHLPMLALLLAGFLLFVASRGGPEVAVVPRPKHRSSRPARPPEVPEPIAEATSNSELIVLWRRDLNEQGATRRTVKDYTHTGEHFLDYVWRRFRKHWSGVTNNHLNAYVERNKEVCTEGGVWVVTDQPIADSTRCNNERVVMRMFAWTVAAGIKRVNPFARRKPMRLPESPERYISRADVNRLFDAAQQDGNLRMLVVLALIFWAGFRVGGIAAARLEDIHWHSRETAVRGKGDGGRVTDWIPMDPELAEILAAWTAGRPRTGPLIPSLTQPSRHVTATHVSRMVARFMRAHGVDETAHGGRHTAGKEIAAVNDNPRAAQLFLTHKSLATTEKWYLKGARQVVWDAVAGRPPRSKPFEVMGPRRPIGPSADHHLHDLGMRSRPGPAAVLAEGHEPYRHLPPDQGADRAETPG